jgi:glycosyltransferase involved in cell wall biosynthesis
VSSQAPIRVLYSFPHKLGAGRICYTAWQQVQGLALAGAEILACPGVLHKSVHPAVTVRPTLAWGKVRIPYKILGRNAFALHDRIVARRIEKLAGQIDIIHTWPLGARETLKAARRFGIPTVLERQNAHTRFAMEVVREECERLGVALPPGHEHAYNEDIILQEEEEYRLADRLLCPSDFVVRTFRDKGFPEEKLVRHQYGFDENVYYPDVSTKPAKPGLTMLFVGVCAVRKGLHFALEAWLRSPAHRDGTFLIAGDFLPAYAEKLAPLLSHPSVRALGHRNDVPELMRKSDILVLPSIEEGYPLVVADAMGSGCVPLTSEVCTGICRHMETGLVHRIGDAKALTEHITTLFEDRALLARLRANCLSNVSQNTWTAAGVRLLEAYRETIASYGKIHVPVAPLPPTQCDSHTEVSRYASAASPRTP